MLLTEQECAALRLALTRLQKRTKGTTRDEATAGLVLLDRVEQREDSPAARSAIGA